MATTTWKEDAVLVSTMALSLFQSQKKPRNLQNDKDYRALFEKINSAYPPISNEDQLKGLLPSAGKATADFTASNQFMYLDPPRRFGTKMAIPVMSIKCDFKTGEFRLRMPIFFHGENDRLCSWGFRYEAPEGPGSHNYFHAQYISVVDKGDNDALPPAVKDFSEKCPTFPLDAQCAPSLFVAAIASVYGIDYIFREAFLAPGLRPRVDGLLKLLHVWDRRPT